MERQQDTRRPLPRRGQVKAGIFASLFRCIFPGEKEASQKLKEGNSGGGGGGGRRVVPRGWSSPWGGDGGGRASEMLKNQELASLPTIPNGNTRACRVAGSRTGICYCWKDKEFKIGIGGGFEDGAAAVAACRQVGRCVRAWSWMSEFPCLFGERTVYMFHGWSL